MDSSTGQCSLFLCPTQHDFTLNDDLLISVLHDIGLLSKKINPQETEHRYFTGDRFLNHVNYMGCAPAIQFEASDTDADFCFIEIHSYDSAKLIHSKKQARAPHCPVCKKPVNNWQQLSLATTILCDACDTTSSIETFDWRKMAGYARVFIEITDIFPREAIPQPALLERLNKAFDNEWLYFYSCRP
jgi:hypothetical protein